MKTIILLRHAKSSWKDSELPDHERPLNKRGRREAPEVGLYLHTKNLLPDLILCSTATRARQTLAEVVEKSGYAGEIQYREDFYPGGPAAFFTALQSLPEQVQSAMIIAHNPGIEEALSALTGTFQPVPTAGLAWVEMQIQSWKDLKGESAGRLVEMWRPSQEN